MRHICFCNQVTTLKNSFDGQKFGGGAKKPSWVMWTEQIDSLLKRNVFVTWHKCVMLLTAFISYL